MSKDHSERRASDAAYRTVFEASPEYITISRLSDGRTIDVNPGFERLMGYSLREILGRSSLELGIWEEPELRKAFLQVVKSGSNRPFFCRLVAKSGRRIPVEAAGSITVMDGEEVLIVVVRDVSERVAKDQELARYRQSLEALVAERTTELQRAQERLQLALEDLQTAHAAAVEGERRSRFEAEHDRLTGLPNRATLEDRLSQGIHAARQAGQAYAVLFIDLDRFKPINDSFGHRVGDMVLCEVAGRLRSAIRASDTIARVGGDEFVVGVAHITDMASVETVARKVRQALHGPLVVEGHRCELGGSIGIALFPRDGLTPTVLIQAADAAMYQAKQSGGGIAFAGAHAASSTPG
ncbi:MAG TPA: sensor domain-containing diguanylate cyclase [Rhizobacter sp.]